jgi:tetratricopeptide (TPR) repeat protein
MTQVTLSRPGPPPTHNWLERIDVIAKLSLSLAGLILSGAIGFGTIRFNRLAAQRQIQNQIESLALQRRTTAAQMLVSQLPVILRGEEQDRALTLKLLEVVDPDLVRQIGEGLLAQAKTQAAVEQAKQVIGSSVETTRKYAVDQHVQNARKYRDFGLYPAAAREYMKACEALPAPLRERLAKRIRAATNDYDSGNYSGAVQTFEEMLRDVKAQFSE